MLDDLNDYARSRVGTSLTKKYRLERLIGIGGMATVYEAVHRNGLRVAIKILHPHLSLNADLRSRFLREGYVANKVKHRGAVRVLDDDSAADGAVFLVMELLEGETLDALFQRSGGRLALRDVCQLADQLLDTLTTAHDLQVVHRDIKPENLFLTTDGILKVLDFGIARLRDGNGPGAATKTGRMIGTPAFMPPEQALGRSRQIDGQTDLWAVGATMFTLASGHFVHEAETAEEMIIRTGSQPARSIHAVLPDAPPAIASVIDRALVFAKEQRWPDARAMRAALGVAYRDAYGATLQVRSSEPSAFAPTALTVDDPTLQRAGAAATAPDPVVGPLAAVPTELATLRASPLDAKHLSTTAGLARTDGGVPAVTGSRSKMALWVVVSVLLLLSGGGMAVRALRSGSTSAALTPSSEPSDTGAPRALQPVPALESTPPPSSSEIPQASAIARTVAPPPKPEAAEPAPVLRRSPTVGPVRSNAGPAPAAAESSASGPLAGAAPSATPAPATAIVPPPPTREAVSPPPAPSCRIVTSYDSNGQPHFQKVCN
jgi:serine/threonine-protein kinase